MSQIYTVFTHYHGSGDPPTLHYIGTNLDSIDLTKIEEYLTSDGLYPENLQASFKWRWLVYVCKFELINGGSNHLTSLVRIHDEPDLIEKHKIFKGSYAEFEKIDAEKNGSSLAFGLV